WLVATGWPSLITVQSPTQKSNCRLSGRDSQGNSAAAASDAAHAKAAATALLPVISFLQRRDVELLHLHHRLERALESRGLRVLHHLDHRRRHDLPRQTELVLEPTALLRPWIASGTQLLPVVVHFLLVLAVHLQRDRLVELEHRPGVERRER